MTLLEEIVQRQVPATLTATFSRTVERIAEEMAEEILRDPTWRAEMREMIQRTFKQTWTDLNQQRQDPEAEPEP